ncbi:MAG: acetate--CoA ligase family protein [Vicinamibacterales bacterium]
MSSFSTMFLEVPPEDGPVGIVSQSGAMSVVPYGLLRRKGIGVRHAHATGNDADVTFAEVALAVVEDPAVRLLLLYIESIRDSTMLAKVAARASERDVPVVVVKAARTPTGQSAARTHTGGEPNDDRVVEAFLRTHRMWRVGDVHEMAELAELHVKGWRPSGRRLAVVSNSGASCVMAADLAHEHGLELARLEARSIASIAGLLPAFATPTNPIDLTAALLSDGSLLGSVLPILAADDAVDHAVVSLPVAGAGYDLAAFAEAAAAFPAGSCKPLVVAATQDSVAEVFRSRGVPVFPDETCAISALAQLSAHAALLRQPPPVAGSPGRMSAPPPPGTSAVMEDGQGLAVLDACGLPVVPVVLCRSEEDAGRAARGLARSIDLHVHAPGVPRVLLADLVRRDIGTEAAARDAWRALHAAARDRGVESDGIVVSTARSAGRRVRVTAWVDNVFGPLAAVADGGAPAHADEVVLVPPFDADGVREAIGRMRAAPMLVGIRGGTSYDVASLCALVVDAVAFVTANRTWVQRVELDPVVVCPAGSGVHIAAAQVTRTPVRVESPVVEIQGGPEHRRTRGAFNDCDVRAGQARTAASIRGDASDCHRDQGTGWTRGPGARTAHGPSLSRSTSSCAWRRPASIGRTSCSAWGATRRHQVPPTFRVSRSPAPWRPSATAYPTGASVTRCVPSPLWRLRRVLRGAGRAVPHAAERDRPDSRGRASRNHVHCLDERLRARPPHRRRDHPGARRRQWHRFHRHSAREGRRCARVHHGGFRRQVRRVHWLGAERAFNYRTLDFVAGVREATEGRGVDMVLDIVGADYFQRNLDVLALEERLVLVGQLGGPKAQINTTPIFRKRLTITGSVLRSRSVAEKGCIAAAVRERVWPLVETGRVVVPIHATFRSVRRPMHIA